MCVPHHFSCGALFANWDQRLSAARLPPRKDWDCWALSSLLRQDVNKSTKAFGQARQRNCSEAFYGASRKFNTQMLSVSQGGGGGAQELEMESEEICTLHFGSVQQSEAFLCMLTVPKTSWWTGNILANTFSPSLGLQASLCGNETQPREQGLHPTESHKKGYTNTKKRGRAPQWVMHCLAGLLFVILCL